MTNVWNIDSQISETFPEGPFDVDEDALKRLYYAVDSTWITHTFAVVFLVLCFIRGVIDGWLFFTNARYQKLNIKQLICKSASCIIRRRQLVIPQLVSRIRISAVSSI